MQENRQFNRTETPATHVYCDQFGFRGLSDSSSEGFIKVKLAHGSTFSVVVPDLLFLGLDAARWIQPLAFHPNIISFIDGDAECALHVDISCGHTLAIRFRESDLVRHLDDGSELYRCTFRGPEDLVTYATGISERTKDGGINVRLFHHTTPEIKDAILKSGHFRLSRWNIQGTKRLKNVGYVYFTPLNQIKFDADLACIAMASNGNITMLVDGVEPPEIVTAQVLFQLKESLLDLPVYRESTRNRTAALPFWVDVAALGPQHIWRHAPEQRAVYYEIARPFIQRIGVPPDAELPFVDDRITETGTLKRFDYAVIGDARTVSGLAAPFDEEDTQHTLKIVRASGSNLFRFWYEHANSNVFSSVALDPQQFEKK